MNEGVFMTETDFRTLVDQYVAGDLSKAGQQQFFELLEDENYRNLLEHILEEEWLSGRFEEPGNDHVRALVQQRVLKNIQSEQDAEGGRPATSVVYMQKYRWAIAAVVLIIVTAGVVFVVQKNSLRNAGDQPVAKETTVPAIIEPGKNGAILTLDNGQQIVLDSVGDGIIASQGASNIVKGEGSLRYQPVNGERAAIVYNTISTPRGRQYPNLMLSDGTRVWLDAGSSIRFPVAFAGKERRVEVSGQAWFEVVHNSEQPFKVIARGVEITDVGTEFNVNAYEDEDELKVTLLEGAVEVQHRLLEPLEQARITRTGSLNIKTNVDPAEVLAWKFGFFHFNRADIQTVMKQISRWYDVEVSYAGNIPDKTFNGKISRNLSLQDLLDGLAFSDIRFRVEGRRLIVEP